ncbi:MAG: hypothetical protein RSC04_00520 [Bacteroidales bacterium]
MKSISKQITGLLYLCLAFSLLSCNKDKDKNEDEAFVTGVPSIIESKSPLFLTNQKFGIKEVIQIELSDDTDTTHYLFNRNQQLIRVEYLKDDKKELIWSNNQLVRIESYDFINNNWVKDAKEPDVLFTYDGQGRLTSCGQKEGIYHETYTYTYPNNHTIEIIQEIKQPQDEPSNPGANLMGKVLKNEISSQNAAEFYSISKYVIGVANNKLMSCVEFAMVNGVWTTDTVESTLAIWENNNLIGLNSKSKQSTDKYKFEYDANNSIERLIAIPLIDATDFENMTSASCNNPIAVEKNGIRVPFVYEYSAAKFPINILDPFEKTHYKYQILYY